MYQLEHLKFILAQISRKVFKKIVGKRAMLGVKMAESEIVKMPFVGHGITEKAAMTKFWEIVESYEAEHQLRCLHAEIIELGEGVHRHGEVETNSKYAAGYGLFSKLKE